MDVVHCNFVGVAFDDTYLVQLEGWDHISFLLILVDLLELRHAFQCNPNALKKFGSIVTMRCHNRTVPLVLTRSTHHLHGDA